MRLLYVLIGLGIVALGTRLVASELSSIGVHQGYRPAQPIAFPHKVHAGDNKIACLYCHAGARNSRHAGIPAVSVCMNCHGMMEKQTVEIERMKEAVQLQQPVSWVKVHNLPDYVYFNHSQHVRSGVECQRCHGPVEKMDRVEQVKPLTMGWCLDCHRENAGQPTGGLQRASLGVSERPHPASGLDCAACHY